jgi:hypothetical protein
MKLSRLIEISATTGAATLVGLDALEAKGVQTRRRHVALYSSLIAVGLALWDTERHHHSGA